MQAVYEALYGAGTKSRTRDLLITSPRLGALYIGKTLKNHRFGRYLGNITGIFVAGVDVMWTFYVQGFSIPSHKLAQCEKGAPSLNPPACMICGTVRTRLRIAQKKHANSVGGRGISAFSASFFPRRFFFTIGPIWSNPSQ